MLSVVEGTWEVSGVSFIRKLISCMGALLSRPNHFSKTPLPNIVGLWVRISIYELEGDTHVQSVAGLSHIHCAEVCAIRVPAGTGRKNSRGATDECKAGQLVNLSLRVP